MTLRQFSLIHNNIDIPLVVELPSGPAYVGTDALGQANGERVPAKLKLEKLDLYRGNTTTACWCAPMNVQLRGRIRSAALEEALDDRIARALQHPDDCVKTKGGRIYEARRTAPLRSPEVPRGEPIDPVINHESLEVMGWQMVRQGGTPLVMDDELNRQLGYADKDGVRKLAKDHVRAGRLEKGKHFHVVAVTAETRMPTGGVRRDEVEHYAFTRKGCLEIIRHSGTAKADELMEQVWDVFLAVQDGQQVNRPGAPATQAELVAAMANQMVTQEREQKLLRAEVNAIKAATSPESIRKVIEDERARELAARENEVGQDAMARRLGLYGHGETGAGDFLVALLRQLGWTGAVREAFEGRRRHTFFRREDERAIRLVLGAANLPEQRMPIVIRREDGRVFYANWMGTPTSPFNSKRLQKMMSAELKERRGRGALQDRAWHSAVGLGLNPGLPWLDKDTPTNDRGFEIIDPQTSLGGAR